jgi:putative inorganic carbon (hco3(-)) transporter
VTTLVGHAFPAVRHDRVLAVGQRVAWIRGLSLAAAAWGALAFGAVYPWAYWPLALACAVAGLLGLSEKSAASHAVPATLSMSFALFGAAVLLQLTPVPLSAVSFISPAASEALRALSLSVAAGLENRHALSIQPAATWTALALFVSFVLLLLGTVCALSKTGARRLVEGLTVLGVVLALVGIVQKPLFTGRIYGLWTPQMKDGSAFGPFVNKNHFAGWMLMALPLTVGLLCAAIAKGLRRVKPGWRNKLLWLASPDANRLILIGAAAILMALSLVLTMSRSGMTAFTLSLVLIGWFVTRRLQGGWRKAAVIVCLALLVAAVAGWVGTDKIATRFSTTTAEFEDRRGAWEDALTIASAFPVTGTGLGTYGVATLFYQRHDLSHHYEQAHNDYLQLLAEGGALLAIPAALVILALALTTRRRARDTEEGSTAYWLRAGAITALVAIGLQELVDFSLQMPGNVALFAIVCAVALHRPPSVGSGQPARHLSPSPRRVCFPND